MSRTRDLGKIISGNFDVPASSLDNVTRSNISDLGIGALSNRNLIINGGFEISQRGDYTSASSYNDGTYHIDRWETLRDGVTATIQHLVPVVGESSYGVKLVATSSTAGTIRLRQRFEIPNIYKWGGRTFTLSARVKSNSSNARLMMYGGSGGGYVTISSDSNDSHTGGGAMETLTATFTTTGSVSSEFAAFVGIDNARSVSDPTITSGDYFEVYDFQLEVGDTATPFEHRSYGDELAKCKRYYANYKATTGDQPHMAFPYAGFAKSTTAAELFGNHPIEMRIRPTVSFNSVTAFRVAIDSTDRDTTNMEVDFVSTTSMRLKLTCATGMTDKEGVGLLNKANTLAIINFDAEL